MMKALRVLVLASFALISCTGPRGAATATPWMETDAGTPTPTPAPYWDLFPLDAQPEGGWKTARIEEFDLTLQHPTVYDEGGCGSLFVSEKAEWMVAGFEGGTIRIRRFKSWSGDLAGYVSESTASADVQLLTAVEPFSLDGVPAFRHIYRIPGVAAPDYVKVAFAASGGNLYMFQYNHMDLSTCDAPPLSEEAVYEHLLSTLEFVH